jgi:hypothetical protein
MGDIVEEVSSVVLRFAPVEFVFILQPNDQFIHEGLGEACHTVVLAHLSQKNNHPEVARMAAEVALHRRGRTEVQLELTSADGTGWIAVGARPAQPSGPMRQLRLF